MEFSLVFNILIPYGDKPLADFESQYCFRVKGMLDKWCSSILKTNYSVDIFKLHQITTAPIFICKSSIITFIMPSVAKACWITESHLSLSDTETLDLGFKLFEFKLQDIVYFYTNGQNIIVIHVFRIGITMRKLIHLLSHKIPYTPAYCNSEAVTKMIFHLIKANIMLRKLIKKCI